MAALEIRNLLHRFRTPEGAAHVVIDVPAFEIADGRQVALCGASGAGKTTLLHLIAGILRADSGTIRVAGREITACGESRRDRLRAASVGYIFQTFNLLQGCTVLENVELAMHFGRGCDAGFARELLRKVGLADRMHYRPRQLSVGQQQRVAVARALANRPQLVLADEPTGSLDPQRAAEALGLIRDLCRESGAALLLVTHDERILSQFEHVEELARINRAAAALAEEPAAP